VAALSLCATAPVFAEPFAQGDTQIYGSVGSGTAFGESYLIVGIGVGYYVLKGLQVGLRADGWFGNSPGIYQLTPELRYVFDVSPAAKPYVGVYYSRTYYEGSIADRDVLGARAGAYFPLGARTYLGAGIVYEQTQSCDKAVYDECSRTYPELSFWLSF
jgi:hypothetical protein